MNFFWGHSFIKFFSLNNLQISNWFTGGLKKLNLKGKTVKKWELSVLLRTKGRLSLPQRQPLITQMRKNYECQLFKTKSLSVMMLHRLFMCLYLISCQWRKIVMELLSIQQHISTDITQELWEKFCTYSIIQVKSHGF